MASLIQCIDSVAAANWPKTPLPEGLKAVLLRMEKRAKRAGDDSPAAAAVGQLMAETRSQLNALLEQDNGASMRVGQRVPKAASSGADAGNDASLTIDAAALRDAPARGGKQALETNVNTMLAYPGFTHMTRVNGTEARLVAVKERIKANLRWLHDQMAPEHRARAKHWYDGANRIAVDRARKHGISPAQAAGVYASLSPQMDWYKNVTLGDRVMDIYYEQQDTIWDLAMDAAALKTLPNESKSKAGNVVQRADNIEARKRLSRTRLGDLTSRHDIAMWIRTYDEAHNERGYRIVAPEGGLLGFVRKNSGDKAGAGWGSYGDISKAVGVLQDGRKANLSNMLGGAHKVRNFYNNIVAPNAGSDVTIDTHAVAAALLRPLAGSDLEVKQNLSGGLGTSSSNHTGAIGTYGIFADAYREIAADLGLLPRELQSITWEAVRLLYTDQFKKAAGNKALIAKTWHASKGKEDGIREKILGLAGGVSAPVWYDGPRGRTPSSSGTSSYEGDVSGRVLAGRGSGSAASGERGDIDRSTARSAVAGRLREDAPSGIPRGVRPHGRLDQGDRGSSAAPVVSHPRAAADGTFALTHWSRQAGLTELDPAKHGTGLSGAETRRKNNDPDNWVDRTYFGIDVGLAGGYRKEGGLGPNRYDLRLHGRQLYDLRDDPDDLRKPRDPNSFDDPLSKYEKDIRDAGYSGYWVANEQLGLTAAVFRKLSPEKETNETRDRGTRRSTSRSLTPLEGAPSVPGYSGPDPRIVDVAEKYAAANGITLTRQTEYARVDPVRAKRIAGAYEAMAHTPNDPKVKAAYADMIKQVTAQYEALVDAGYEFWFIDVSTPTGEQYSASPWNAMRDVRANKRMGVFPTVDGFGSSPMLDTEANPLEADTPFQWPWGGPDGKMRPVLANDLFRAVHDAFGHGMEGAGFRAEGEENAWQAHVRLFKGPAVGAVTSETRGQNSWLNYGPNGESNRTAKVEDTVFADQKTGLMPSWTWTEGVVRSTQRAQTNTPAFKKWFGDSKVVDENGDPLVVYHGTGVDVSAFRASRKGWYGKGMYFTDDPASAEEFSYNHDTPVVMPVVLNMQRPYYYEEPPFYDRDPDDEANFALIREVLPKGKAQRLIAQMRSDDTGYVGRQMQEALHKMGHDGLIVSSVSGPTEYIVFSPTQIKSATGNNGEFDASNPRIDRSMQRAQTNTRSIPEKYRQTIYHTSPRVIDKIEAVSHGQFGDVLFFAPEPYFMTGAPDPAVYRLDVDERNLIDASSLFYDESAAKADPVVADFARRWGVDNETAQDLISEIQNAFDVFDDTEIASDVSWAAQAAAAKAAVAMGYEGAVGQDEQGAVYMLPMFGRESDLVLLGPDAIEEPERQYGTPTQIKSATGNNGEFDATNPDIRRSMQRAAQSWAAPENTAFDNFIRKFQDKHIDTRRAVTAIAQTGKVIDDTWNPYQKETLSHGRKAKQVKDFLFDEIRPIFQAMLSKGLTMDAVNEYMHMRHAEEANVRVAAINPNNPTLQDGGSGVKTADARAYLAALAPGQKRDFDAVATRLDVVIEGTRQMMVDSGLESQDTINTWKATYKHYVPLMREDVETGMGTGAGYSVSGPSSKRRMGSTKGVIDILPNLMMQRERIIDRAESNRVAQATWGLAAQNANEDFWQAIDPELNQWGTNNQVMLDNLLRLGIDPADAESIAASPMERYTDPRTGLVKTRVNNRLATMANAMSMRINGKDKFVVFSLKDERAARMVGALKNANPDQLGFFLTQSAKVSRWISSVNTQYNPIFGVVNLLRDVQTAAINLSSTPLASHQAEVLRQSMPALMGVFADIRARAKGQTTNSAWGQMYERFQNAGGQTGYRDMFANSEERAKDLQKEINKLVRGKVRSVGPAMMQLLSQYNEAMENAVRVAAFKTALDQGMSEDKAASLAKDLTVNFNRKGTNALQAGALYAFFNAATQGTARIAETVFDMQGSTDWKKARLSKAGVKILAGGMMLGVLQALMMAAAGFDDEEPPEFIRERNIVIPIGGGKYISIPMPLGFHVIPNLTRIPTEWALSGFKHTPDRVASMFMLFADAFNPIGTGATVLQTIMPTPLDPIAALAENKDWTGKPIARTDFNSLKPTPGYTRSKDTATPWADAISYATNFLTGGTDYKPGLISPTADQIDFLIGQATGGVGREASKFAQVGSSAVTGTELPLYKIPLVGRFAGTTTGQAPEGSKFYRNLKEIGQHDLEIKGRREAREPVAEYIRDNPEARLTQAANAAQRRVSALRKRKRELVDRGANPESVRMVEQQITQQMQQFNQRVEALQ